MKKYLWLIVIFLLIISLISCAVPVTNTTVTTEAETTIIEVITTTAKVEEIKKIEETAAETTVIEEFEEATCIRVVDGDTIEIKDSAGKTFKVRYIGIDTPENGDNYFKEAKEANEKLVLDKTIKMYKDVSETDRYERLLRYIYVGAVFVNAYLVENGFAMASTYPPDVEHSDYFAELQNTAQSKGAGFWGIEAAEETTKQTTETTVQETTTETSAETTATETTVTETTVTETTAAETTSQGGPFVGSVNSDVYHYPDCASAKQIHPENLITFSSVEDAKAHGYRPCKRCNPPG